MKTINIDGLPGITIQGKKGQDGRPGNKTIFYSEPYIKSSIKKFITKVLKNREIGAIKHKIFFKAASPMAI